MFFLGNVVTEMDLLKAQPASKGLSNIKGDGLINQSPFIFHMMPLLQTQTHHVTSNP